MGSKILDSVYELIAIVFITITIVGMVVFNHSCAVERNVSVKRSNIHNKIKEVYERVSAKRRQQCYEKLEEVQLISRYTIIPGTNRSPSTACKKAGCHIVEQGKSYIWCSEILSFDQYRACIVHELLHALLLCICHNSDRTHKISDVWCNSGVLCSGKSYGEERQSVEYLVDQLIW